MAPLSASGTYLLSGDDGPPALERFTCGADGDGWRYHATRSDAAGGAELGRVELELAGLTTRLHVELGGWVLRGAAAGGEVLWRRGEQERSAQADGFTGTSPGFLVLVARLARPRLRLVELTEPALATRTVDRSWRPLGEDERDGVTVTSYEVDDLSTGERRTVRLAGDVVVEAPGVRLQALTLS